MEVLSNGFVTKFWIPIEDEPDIDRFIDEDIAIDMDTFTLRGTLLKVSTCKKKNPDTKEFEYYKELKIEVSGIESTEDPTQNVIIPDKKEEYGYHVEFRYVPVPEQLDEEPAADEDLRESDTEGLGPEEELDFEDEKDPADDPHDEAFEGDDDLFEEEAAAEEQDDSIGAPEEDDFFPDESEADAFVDEPNEPNPDEDPEPELSETTVTDDEFFDEEPDDGETGSSDTEEPVSKNKLPDDDDDIDWDD